jgi:hypothetical protein
VTASRFGAVILAFAPLAAVHAQTTGLVPLTDLGAGSYEGFQGGLYPGGLNLPPATHFAAAMAKAREVVPRNALGVPDPQGAIVMIAVGMSNTTHEFGAFERNEDASPNRNARVVLMDTGLGGQTAAIIADPAAAYWTVMAQRLNAMGLTAAQVQVAWLKEADGHPPDDFPGHATALRNELELVVNNLHDKFPNLKLCYLSSRIYGGYAPAGSLNPEPQAYESGFSVKWLIGDQIASDPGLNHGQLPGPVRAPLLLWGPYLWADGTNPRSDGLTWQASDLEADHTHPSPAGEQKVAALLSSFFATEASAQPWWPAATDVGRIALAAFKDAHVSAASPSANFGAAATLLEQGGALPQVPYLGFDLAAVPRPVVAAKLSLRVLAAGGGRVFEAADTSWGETTITHVNAPGAGALLKNLPQSSRDGTIAADVTGNVNADPDGALTYLLSTTAEGLASYHSREAGAAPRLVLTVPCASSADGDGDGRADPCDCASADPSAFAVPGEVRRLRWLDRATLAWDSASALAGAGTTYDVASGDLAAVAAVGSQPGDACIGSGIAATSIFDATPDPLAGEGRFYLARAVNACGTGRWETGSDGRDRAIAACP